MTFRTTRTLLLVFIVLLVCRLASGQELYINMGASSDRKTRNSSYQWSVSYWEDVLGLGLGPYFARDKYSRDHGVKSTTAGLASLTAR